MNKPIYLLDLNYTLVSNSDQKLSPFTLQIEHEAYRLWLVDLLRNETVYLVTARPAKYQRQTVDSIELKTGWKPDRVYFNKVNLPPPEAKRHVLLNHLAPLTDSYVAIESNPRTRAMYASYGIPSLVVQKHDVWTSIPEVKA